VLQEIMNNPKVTLSVTAATAAMGSSAWLEWIPAGDLGKIATLVGIFASIFILAKVRIEIKKALVELEIAQLEREEKRAVADLRKREGLPVRRIED